jgi:hypothetical protein
MTQPPSHVWSVCASLALLLVPLFQAGEPDAAERIRRSREFHLLAQQRAGLLIPLYVYPANIHTNATYNQLIALKRRHASIPFWVILNPASGPGSNRDANYTKAIDRLQGAGCLVLGYVSTRYGKREASAVSRELETWLRLYPRVQGVFFDEMINEDTDQAVDHQRSLTSRARANGYWPVVANPGADTPGRFFEADAADVFVIHEGSTWPEERRLKGDFFGGYSDYPPSTRAVLVHSRPRMELEELAKVTLYTRWVYITNDAYTPGDPRADNPWNSLSEHLDSICNELEKNSGNRL